MINMEAKKIYKKLERDFIKPGLSDDWVQYMDSIKDYLSDNFKKRSMGLVCDFTADVNKVYTAVFPSNHVMETILETGETDVMLFVHHPSIWDIRRAPEVFYQMDRSLLEKFKEKRISIYNLHVPLDNYGEYSTSVSLAKALEFEILKPFALYFGGLCGVFAKTDLKTVSELKERLEKTLGHKAGLYDYGDDLLSKGKVAIAAGGGNDIQILREIAEEGVNTFITGISAKNDHSRKPHEYAEKNGINVLGGTHYSTEKFACIAMCDYFKKMNLSSNFIPDKPVMEDL